MGYNRFDVGCCCGCPIIGFDRSIWTGVTTCCSGMSPIINLKDDVSRLSECKVVFAGHIPGACTNSIYFASGDWSAVRSYIENGGRFWLNLEYSGCLQDSTNAASFLSALGTGITWGNTHEGNESWSPGAANIAQGATFATGDTSKINGGTTVFVNANGNAGVAVEKLGDGFLFVVGDSEALTDGGYTGCTFIKRLWEYGDDEIL